MIAAAERRLAEAAARRDVELFGGRRDIHPAEALLELVQWTAGEVDYWRQRVRELDEAVLTWGVTKVKEGGDDHGTTKEAKPHIAYVMYVDATKRLREHSEAALRAGASEQLLRVVQSQGSQLGSLMIAVLADLGHDVSPGSEAALVVLRHLAPLRSAAQVAAGEVA